MIRAAIAVIAFNLFIVSDLRARQGSAANDIPRCAENPEVTLPEKMTRPKYPKAALNAGKGGNVELRGVISPDGKTKDLIVLEGDPEFSNPALEWIRKWHFDSVSVQGQAVETTYKIHVRFNPLLQEADSDVDLESPRIEVAPVLPANLQDSTDGTVYKSSDPGVVPPKPVYSPEPEFTERARKAKEQGMVTLYVVVGADGLSRQVRGVCGPTPDLTEQAIELVKLWKFSAGTKDGKPVPVRLLVDVSFKLF
jgi:TonB family protein